MISWLLTVRVQYDSCVCGVPATIWLQMIWCSHRTVYSMLSAPSAFFCLKYACDILEFSITGILEVIFPLFLLNNMPYYFHLQLGCSQEAVSMCGTVCYHSQCVNCALSTPSRDTGGVEVQLHSFLTSVIGGSEWSTSCLSCFTPGTLWIAVSQWS
jgi:hypothetical protein